MAQVKLLKISSVGIADEFDSANDDVTLASFAVTGGGPVLSGTGLDLNNQDVSDVNDLSFNDPTTGTIGATVPVIVDDLMAVERENTMTTAGSVAFPVITDDAGEVDAFRLPALAGAPSATPTNGGEGHLVWDSTNDKMYAWNGTAWDDLSTVQSAESVDNIWTADIDVAASDVVYISAADSVSPALGDSEATARAIGFAVAAALEDADVIVRSEGNIGGFTGLTAGSRYYLSAATAGAVTATRPVGSGNVLVQVGYAKSATAMKIQFQNLGRLA